MQALRIVAFLIGFCGIASAQTPSIEAMAAAELRSMCSTDAGALWGVSMCGPLIIVDPETRTAWAAQPDTTGILQPAPDRGGWSGVLPADVPVANTSANWGGVNWIMVLAPLPTNSESRRVLLAHEAWHRIQSSIGLPATSANNGHLDLEPGRYLLRLEMKALVTAMMSRGSGRRRAAADALIARAARLSWYPAGAAGEAALDRNEGLAAYTGVKLGAGDNAHSGAARTLETYDQHDALARSYAYATGPAYGLLLDEYLPSWRRSLASYAPADLLARVLEIPEATDGRLRRVERRYDGQTIALQERERAERQIEVLEAFRARFLTGPRLYLPLTQAQMSFDPHTVTPLDQSGNVYNNLTLRDAWGQITASDGALISNDFSNLTVDAPTADGLSGPGWRLSLAPGFEISPPEASGVRRVRQTPPPTR